MTEFKALETEKYEVIKKLSEQQLDDLIKQAKNRKKELKQEKVLQKKEEAKKHIEWLREHKDFILSQIQHTRTSCGTGITNNGLYYEVVDNKEYLKFRCPRCAIEEILNGEWGDDNFEINFSIDIIDIDQYYGK